MTLHLVRPFDAAPPVDFGEFVRGAGELVVQPRMGFGSARQMRAGLAATRAADATTVGTIAQYRPYSGGSPASVANATTASRPTAAQIHAAGRLLTPAA